MTRFAIVFSGLLLALAACGDPDVAAARKAAQEKKLPPTEAALLSQTKSASDKEARLLVEAGVNPNARQANGMTALMSAAFNGKLETAQALLDKGAEVNASAGGYNALGLAVEKGDKAMVKLLLQYGADPALVPEKGQSALMRAQNRPDRADLVPLLEGKS